MAYRSIHISRKLQIRYKRLNSSWKYLWLFTIITAISLFLCSLIDSWKEIYIRSWFKNYYHAISDGFSGSYENYIQSLYMDSIYESAILTTIVLIAIIILILLLRFALWLLDNICSIILYFGQYMKSVLFPKSFYFIGGVLKKYL